MTITIAAGGDVTVSPASLTFTKDNGTSAQKVNVTAGPDEDTDDDMDAISHTASSSDSDYDGINIAGISVTIVDSDRGVTVSQDSFTIDEGSTDTYTIKLDEAPTADVTITFSVSGDGDVTVSPGSLTFSDTSPQTVSVTAGEDDNADNETATISHTATSSDGHYSGISIDNIAVTIIDDDEEAIAVVVVPVTPTPTPTATPTPTPSPNAAAARRAVPHAAEPGRAGVAGDRQRHPQGAERAGPGCLCRPGPMAPGHPATGCPDRGGRGLRLPDPAKALAARDTCRQRNSRPAGVRRAPGASPREFAAYLCDAMHCRIRRRSSFLIDHGTP